jgi:hypothetical protein
MLAAGVAHNALLVVGDCTLYLTQQLQSIGREEQVAGRDQRARRKRVPPYGSIIVLIVETGQCLQYNLKST